MNGDPARLFTWMPADTSAAGHIAVSLGMIAKLPCSEVILESSIELQNRYPRLSDAWRFFHASAYLFAARMTEPAACAQRIGARIALAVTGWTVTDMCLAESGRSAAFGVFVQRPNWPEPKPVVLEICDTATGETVQERAGAFTPQAGAFTPQIAAVTP
jgi:hypothetical protein